MPPRRVEPALTADADAPLVEILGPWLKNKGDALMLDSVIHRLGSSLRLAASSGLGADADAVRRRGLATVRWSAPGDEISQAFRSGAWSHGVTLLRRNVALSVLPRRMLGSKGFVAGEDVVALLDCSGFAYGDQWSTVRIERRIRYYERLRTNGASLVLLPQALGPFTRSDVRTAAQLLFAQFDRLYARDAASYAHMRDLGVSADRLRQCPDITHLLAGSAPALARDWGRCVAVVPNARMRDKTSPDVAARYLDFLVHAIMVWRNHGYLPILLLHEPNDITLAREVLARLPFDVELVDVDARQSKGILGLCHAVVSSRYHALVSALSQGVPAIGTSWAHKYDGLFDEYGCTEMLVSPAAPLSQLSERIDALARRDGRALRSAALKQAAARQAWRVQRMWGEIEVLLAREPDEIATQRA